MRFADVAHSGLIVMAVIAGVGLVTAFIGMDRNASAMNEWWAPARRISAARLRLQRWTWTACYASIVLAASLLSLLIGA